jgi:hypothetical protein
MSKNLNITGRDTVIANLQKSINKIKGGTERGLVRAGLLIMRKSSTLVPVDTSNLQKSVYIVSNSAVNHVATPNFVNTRRDAAKQTINRISALNDARARVTGSDPKVEVGYSTTYAAAVHEHVNVPHSVGQAKYLEAAVKSSVSDIVNIIKTEASV